MRSRTLLLLRTLLVMALLAIMPLLAVPQVAHKVQAICGRLLAAGKGYGEMRGGDPPPRQDSNSPNSPLLDAATRAGESYVRHSPATHHTAMANSSSPGDISPNAPQSKSNRVRFIHERLKQFGATYARLETVGQNQDVYRFHCQIPVNNSVYSRTFESRDADPLLAMERVLAEVQSWRVARNHRDEKFPASDRRTIR